MTMRDQSESGLLPGAGKIRSFTYGKILCHKVFNGIGRRKITKVIYAFYCSYSIDLVCVIPLSRSLQSYFRWMLFYSCYVLPTIKLLSVLSLLPSIDQPFSIMPPLEGKEEYIMAADPEELNRLTDQHQLIKDHMGTLVLAPADLSKPNLRILDSATADGKACSLSLCYHRVERANVQNDFW